MFPIRALGRSSANPQATAERSGHKQPATSLASCLPSNSTTNSHYLAISSPPSPYRRLSSSPTSKNISTCSNSNALLPRVRTSLKHIPRHSALFITSRGSFNISHQYSSSTSVPFLINTVHHMYTCESSVKRTSGPKRPQLNATKYFTRLPSL